MKEVSIEKIENLCKEIIEKIDKTSFILSKYDMYYLTKRFDDYHKQDTENHIYKQEGFFNISHTYFSIVGNYEEDENGITKFEITSYEMKKYFIYDNEVLYKIQETLDFYLRKINDNIKTI